MKVQDNLTRARQMFAGVTGAQSDLQAAAPVIDKIFAATNIEAVKMERTSHPGVRITVASPLDRLEAATIMNNLRIWVDPGQRTFTVIPYQAVADPEIAYPMLMITARMVEEHTGRRPTDSELEQIADRMGENYQELLLGIDLPIIVEAVMGGE